LGINSASDYGRVSFPGNVALGGRLSAHLNNGYIPAPGNTLAVVVYGSESGAFSAFSLPPSVAWQPSYGPTAFILTVSDVGPVLVPLLSPSGQFTLRFAGETNNNYTVLATTNLSLPLSSWPSLGPPSLLSNNIYQFIDTQSGGFPRRFYVLRSP
jgi:hypothetical protein